MKQLKVGTIRNLQSCSTRKGVFGIIAVDHRDALRAAFNPERPMVVTDQEMEEFKGLIASYLAPYSSAIILDPVYSAPQSIVSGKLPPVKGLLIAIEEQGYIGDPLERKTTLMNGWSVEKINRIGGSGVKMLVFYHPNAGDSTYEQEVLIQSTAVDCERYEIPLFIEPISYSVDKHIKKGDEKFAKIRPQIVVDIARRLSLSGAHVLKLEFPVDVKFEKDRKNWESACQEVSKVSQLPWILLSAGEPFEIFKEQLKIACKSGCSGFAVGRAIWQEAIKLEGSEREDFLNEVARPRLQQLLQIADNYGSSWQTYFTFPEIDTDWHKLY
jgi:tagatose-1,6-bisphosphate aldolase